MCSKTRRVYRPLVVKFLGDCRPALPREIGSRSLFALVVIGPARVTCLSLSLSFFDLVALGRRSFLSHASTALRWISVC